MSIDWPMTRPNDNRVYGLNWGAFLQTGETIATSTWTLPTIAGAPTNSGGDQGITAGTQTYIRLTGGLPGVLYVFVNEITTTLGNVTEQTVTLPMDPA